MSSSRDDLPNAATRSVVVRPSASLKRMSDLTTVALSLSIILALLWLLSDVILVLFAATLLGCQLAGGAHFVSRLTKLSSC